MTLSVPLSLWVILRYTGAPYFSAIASLRVVRCAICFRMFIRVINYFIFYRVPTLVTFSHPAQLQR